MSQENVGDLRVVPRTTRSSTRRTVLVASAISCLLLTACGGGGSGGASFTAKANAACSELRQKTAAFAKPSNPNELARYLKSIVPLQEDGLTRLRVLTAPSSKTSVWNAFLRDMQEGVSTFQQLRNAAQRGDLAAVRAIGERAQRSNQSTRLTAEAKRLGLYVCAAH